MNSIFADTFYFFALLSPSDSAHARALAFTRTFAGKMVTTAWVLTELADGMAAPINRQRCVRFIEGLRVDPDVRIVPADAMLFEAGLTFYASRRDKEWSLTDCISLVVMQREGITEALTGDHHFEQAGFRVLLK